MLHQCRHNRPEACEPGSKGHGTAVGNLCQIHILVELARHGIAQCLQAFLQRLGVFQHLFYQILLKRHTVCQHHDLVQVQRGCDVMILLGPDACGQ